ncbi:FAD-dependent oxidoreductase [Arthrobacter bambusae]|uniref:FAD-dependent oxidoreductase n=1 Tax=Arthrobacter sp. NPDC058127 TaxID=3346351 RepID=UPI0036EDAC83
MYGAPAVDGVSVKATLDGRGGPTPDPNAVPREMTPAEITEITETVTEFLPGLFPNIVRSDAFPDLFTTDGHPLLGRFKEGSRIYCATGFSGAGFKKATGFDEIAAPRSPRQTILRGPGIRPAPTLQLTRLGFLTSPSTIERVR